MTIKPACSNDQKNKYFELIKYFNIEKNLWNITNN